MKYLFSPVVAEHVQGYPFCIQQIQLATANIITVRLVPIYVLANDEHKEKTPDSYTKRSPL